MALSARTFSIYDSIDIAEKQPYYSHIYNVNKFGRNNDIDTASPEDIWAGGGTRVFLSSAETIEVVSDDVNDTSDGTGARTVQLQGLDSNYKFIEETITLNGTSVVTSTKSYLRVYRSYVVTAGSSGSNEGTITFDPTSSGSGSRQALIELGDGQTLISHFTVPAGYTAYMVGGQLGVTARDGGTGVKEARIRFFKREQNKAWRIQQEFSMRSDGTSVSPDIVFTIPNQLVEKTDLKFVGNVDNNNTSIYVQYCLVLKAN